LLKFKTPSNLRRIPLLKGIKKKIMGKAIHFAVQNIYYSFREAVCSSSEMMFSTFVDGKIIP
jgi:hypothetical protein